MKAKMSDCVFCKIINQEIPAEFLYQNKQVLVIRDINPKAPVHLLVIPKRHIESLAQEINGAEEIYSALLKAARHMASEQGLGQSGYRVVINTGNDGGQEVNHLHLHVLGGKQLNSIVR